MKITPIAATFVMIIATPSFAFEARIENLLGRYSAYDDICRGSSGDEQATHNACDYRNEVGVLLGKEGFCYGKDGQAGYQMRWHKCGKKSIKP
jgi:hypothetical protein